MRAFQEHRSYSSNVPVSIHTRKSIDFLAHWHTDVEIIYITHGRHTIGVNQEVYLLEKGDILICSSGDIHFYIKTDPDARLLMLIFKPEFIGYSAGWPRDIALKHPLISPNLSNLDTYTLKTISRIHILLEELLNENTTKFQCYEDSIKSKLLEICVLILRNFPTTSANIKNSGFKKYNLQRMQTTLKYLEENYMKKISLSELSAYNNLSPFHFSRLFTSTVGMSFKEYINKRRIEHAELLLKEDKLSITQIAFECGFDSIRTFHRVFKEIKGTSPSKLK